MKWFFELLKLFSKILTKTQDRLLCTQTLQHFSILQFKPNAFIAFIPSIKTSVNVLALLTIIVTTFYQILKHTSITALKQQRYYLSTSLYEAKAFAKSTDALFLTTDYTDNKPSYQSITKSNQTNFKLNISQDLWLQANLKSITKPNHK